jgi:hypothetical protein
MTTHCCVLRDNQWKRIKHLLPGRRGAARVACQKQLLHPILINMATAIVFDLA